MRLVTIYWDTAGQHVYNEPGKGFEDKRDCEDQNEIKTNHQNCENKTGGEINSHQKSF